MPGFGQDAAPFFGAEACGQAGDDDGPLVMRVSGPDPAAGSGQGSGSVEGQAGEVLGVGHD